MKTIIITGKDLTIEEIYSLAYDRGVRVRIAPQAAKRMAKSRAFLDSMLNKKIIYGVNTGFGPMASHILGQSQIAALQNNLVRSHAAGMGDPLPEPYVLAAMVVRLNTLVKGYSAASYGLAKQLERYINARIIPVIPEHGAVGTSGDLVQLAHIALALIGEGEVHYRGKRESTAHVLKRLRVKAYVLKPKEGLSLINGTSMMAGMAAISVIEARRLLSIALRTGAFSLETVHAFDDGISKELNATRPHPGQQLAARTLRALLLSSHLMRNRKKFQKEFTVTETLHTIPESVQEVYSLRCIPQVLGPIMDTLQKVTREVEVEINSVTDNPIVDLSGKAFLHGGNFHGDYIAAGIDQLKAALVKLTMLSERRINFFLNAHANHTFPPFANLKKPGLTLGLQGLQFVATSTTAQNQNLAFPQHIHSIPTNGDNQDIVSMGSDAVLMAFEVIRNAYIVLSIELVTLAQIVDLTRTVKKYSLSSQRLFGELRKIFPAVVDDRSMAQGLEKVLRHMKQLPVLDIDW